MVKRVVTGCPASRDTVRWSYLVEGFAHPTALARTATNSWRRISDRKTHPREGRNARPWYPHRANWSIVDDVVGNGGMVRKLRVLIVEDSDDDVALLLRELRRSYEPVFE